ncbi:hypothetical protein PGTUg99_017190 [Puccinia graminis f. sp. tritici]|uniref:Uncharacterized protein n=1 Tax=Puccinia graminis f. sp. tritici TaxID=56615 RepID=A0A5B0R4M5_PUCGR|nr:hypothetical protein PGTUg99_017190 [Puccinia graminis f. sp. tritici]
MALCSILDYGPIKIKLQIYLLPSARRSFASSITHSIEFRHSVGSGSTSAAWPPLGTAR